MEQRAYWDLVSDSKQFTTPFQDEVFTKYVGKNALILDVGCGYGRTLHQLNQLGYKHLIGIDFSEKMIKRGRAEYPDLDLRVKDSDSIEMDPNSVDAVILFAVLTCMASDQEQEMLVSEISRVLRPNGILYINDFLLNSDERNLKRYGEYEEKYGVYGVFELPEGAILRHHDEQWIKKLLGGFHMLEYEHLTFTTMNGHTSNGFYYFGKKKGETKLF